MKYRLAVDLGASSLRVTVEDQNKQLFEVYRFQNGPVLNKEHLTWEIDRIFQEIKIGLKLAIKKYQTIESMAIDSFGCDYVVMHENEKINPVFSYRDRRTFDIIDEVYDRITAKELYQISGIQFQPFNTIFQLYKDKKEGRLDKATDFLMIPEYFTYLLTGRKVHERTMASTTGILDTSTLEYSKEIVNRLGFNETLFKNIQNPSFFVGNFTKEIEEEVGGNIPVYLTTSHDTASSVEGIDLLDDIPYLSSGTWSLIGIKQKEPIKTDEAMTLNYSNERGPSYFRFQKNIMGLWITQRLHNELKLDYLEMARISRESNNEATFDVNDERFLNPPSMKDEIITYFKERGIIKKWENKDLLNAVYRSLAKSYSIALSEIEYLTNKKYDKLVIVGGGASNLFLNEMTKYYTQKELIILPIESSTIGNIKNQKGED